jgi:hypothetical protein
MTIGDDGAKNFHVRPSLDGSGVAFDSDRNCERGVYIANVDGTDAHRVTGAGFAALADPTAEEFAWAPDFGQQPNPFRSWIACRHDRRLR